MALNTNNSSNESIEENKKDNNGINLDTAQKDFIESKLKNDIMYFDNLDFSNLSDSFFSFLKTKNIYKDLSLKLLSSTDWEKLILKNQLQSEISKIVLPRNRNINKIKEIFFNEYELNDSQKSDIYNQVKKIWNSVLINLLKNSKTRNDFLVKFWIFKNNDEALNFKKSTLKNIESKFNLDFSLLNEDEKEKLIYIFSSNNKISLKDIKEILPFFNDKSKISLLNYFLDFISYKDLEDNNLLTDNLKNSIFNDFKNKSSKYLDWFSEEDIINSFESIDKSEYLLDLNNLSWNLLDLLKDDKVLEKIVSSYNSELEIDLSTNNSIMSKLKSKWDNENINDSFIDFISSDNDINKAIKDNIWKLKEWNFIELINKNSDWLENSTYYYIEKTDSWTVAESKKIILKDVTSKNWWYNKNLNWDTEKYWYNSFYNLLKNISLPTNKSNFIKFHESNDLKDKEIVDDNNIETIEELKNKFDLIDPDWKNINFNSNEMVLELEWDDNFVFNIDSIKWNKITIDQWWSWKITVDFNEFYNVISEWNIKRKNKVNDFEWLKKELNNIWVWSFEWLKIWWKNDDKIILWEDKWEVANSKDYIWVKVFVASSWDAIYVNEISNNEIFYTKWKYDDSKKQFKKSTDSYSSSNFSQFLSDIAKYKLEPIINDIKWNITTEAEEKWEKELKKSFFSRYMTRMSFNEIIAWLKFLPDTIQKNLERWNKLKSLKFAQKVAWLSWKNNNFYLSMKSAAEQEEKSLIEEITNNLKSLWSKDMINQIERILLNINSDETELIWALMTIVWKYWVLYPKSLKKYQWSFIWYKRLWWTDKFKKDAEAKLKDAKSPDWRPQPVFFTEERLVELWLWERGKEGSIRSKLDKDYWNALSSWMKDEMADWEMKAWNQVTTWWRIKYFVDQLWSMEYANAVWSIEKVFWKNGSSIEMQSVPFILTMSWFSKNFDQVLLNKIIWISFSSPFTSLFFNKDIESINLYRNYIEEVIKDKYWVDSWIFKDYLWIKKNSWPEDHINSLYDFWKKHWKELVNHINLSDPYTIMKKDTNPVFNNYYKMLKWVHSDWEFDVKADNIIHWIYDKNPVAYTWWLLWFITSDTVWSLWRDENRIAYKMYIDSLKKFRDYNTSELWISPESLRKSFDEIFWPFAEKIAEKSWSYKEWNSPFVSFYKWELWIPIFDEAKYSSKEEYLDSVYDDFMNYKWKWSLNTQDIIRTKINDIVDFDKSE